jgi:hypothetical protein
MIYIIGDSHVSVFSGTDTKEDNGQRHIQPEFGTCYTVLKGSLQPHNKFEQRIPYFTPIRIGPNTAYNSFNKLPIIEQVIEEYLVTDDDYVFLCFGEIDIRNHIGPYMEKTNISLSDSIKVCVDRYFTTILHLQGKVNRLGVYGPPASSVGYPVTFGYKDVTYRNKMTFEFNTYLKSKCVEHGILFKQIATEMLHSDGTTNQEFIMDDIHLSQTTMPLIMTEFSDIINEIK